MIGVVSEDTDEFIDEHLDDDENPIDDDASSDIGSFLRDDEFIENIKSHSRIVITTAQNNTEVDQQFLTTLKNYCSEKDAALVIIPIRYRSPEKDVPDLAYAESIAPYLVDNNIMFENHQVVIMGGLKLLATAVNPLSSMDAFSKGKTLILGHPQLQLRTMARGKDTKYPPILSTTGSITKEKYSVTKSGISADFNHSMSAAVIEFTDNEFFIRHLNYDSKMGGFCDLDQCFAGNTVTPVEADAIVTGDSHVVFHDKEVYSATYGDNGLFVTMKPKHWVVHDVLDFFARGHHTNKDQFISFLKHLKNMECVKTEVEQACEFLMQNRPWGCHVIVVGSNHDIHLDRWLKETDIRKDPINAKFFHWLSFLMYEYMEDNDGEIPAALSLYFSQKYPEISTSVKFLKEFDSFKLHGIELGTHGANGLNGSRGSLQQFTNLPTKTITGHSHQPAINKGSYVVGTSSIFHMGYVKSASGWDQAHCIIHPNGKRQLVFLRNGKFRA